MATAEVSIRIMAYDMATRVMRSVGAAASSLASSVGKAVKWGAIGGLTAATAAVTGLAYWIVKATNAQDAADASLRGVLRGYGLLGAELDAVTKKYNDLAAAIQKETGADDEATLGTITRLQQLGVLTEQMDAAARAAVGLTAVGLDEAAAAKAVANAMQGEFAALTRYIPALKQADTLEEKRAIVAKAAAVGYAAVAERLNTVGGATGALKGAFENLLQQIGQAALGGSGFAGIILDIRKRLVSLGESESFQKLLTWIRTASAEAAALSKVLLGISTTGSAAQGWAGVGDLLAAALKMGAAEGANLIYQAFVKGVDYLRGLLPTFRDMFNPLTGGPAGWALRGAGSAAGKASVSAEQGIRDLADVAALRAEYERALAALRRAAQKELAANPPAAPGATPSPAPGLAGAIGAAMKAGGVGKDEEERIEKLRDKIKDLRKAEEEASQALDIEKRKAAWDAENKSLEEQIALLEKRRDAANEALKGGTFGAGFDAWRQQQAEAKAEQDNAQAQMDRFNQLQAKAGKRGLKLSAEDQRFLDEMQGRIDEANKNIGIANAAQAAIDAAQAARDVVQQNIEASAATAATRLQEIRDDLKTALAAPGV